MKKNSIFLFIGLVLFSCLSIGAPVSYDTGPGVYTIAPAADIGDGLTPAVAENKTFVADTDTSKTQDTDGNKALYAAVLDDSQVCNAETGRVGGAAFGAIRSG